MHSRDVPTHRDHPWERDARAAARSARSAAAGPGKDGRVAPRRTGWWAWATLAVIGALVLGLKLTEPGLAPGEAVGGPTAVPHAVAVPTYRVQALRSRYVTARRIRMWGSATAPAGTRVEVRVRIDGSSAALVRTIRVGQDGLFEADIRVPPAHSRSARVSARVIR